MIQNKLSITGLVVGLGLLALLVAVFYNPQPDVSEFLTTESADMRYADSDHDHDIYLSKAEAERLYSPKDHAHEQAEEITEEETPEVEESDEPAPKSEESKWWNPKKKN